MAFPPDAATLLPAASSVPAHDSASWRVLLVDDQPEFLDLARRLFAVSPEIDVVGLATSGVEAVSLMPTVRPQLAVVDLQMPGMSGLETTRRLLQLDPNLIVVLVSALAEPQFADLAARSGAAGFIDKKSLSAATVLSLVRAVLPHSA